MSFERASLAQSAGDYLPARTDPGLSAQLFRDTSPRADQHAGESNINLVNQGLLPEFGLNGHSPGGWDATPDAVAQSSSANPLQTFERDLTQLAQDLKNFETFVQQLASQLENSFGSGGGQGGNTVGGDGGGCYGGAMNGGLGDGGTSNGTGTIAGGGIGDGGNTGVGTGNGTGTIAGGGIGDGGNTGVGTGNGTGTIAGGGDGGNGTTAGGGGGGAEGGTTSTASGIANAESASVQVIANDGGGEESLGSGFFVSSNGLLATDYHVVQGAQGPIQIDTANGQTLEATPVVTDQANDIAILQIEGQGANQTFPTLTIGNENQVSAVDYAVGHPEGDPNIDVNSGNYVGETTFGSFDVIDNTVADNPNRPLLEFTDMGTEPGSSGSPIINSSGIVIGMDDLGDGSGDSDATVASAIAADAQVAEQEVG